MRIGRSCLSNVKFAGHTITIGKLSETWQQRIESLNRRQIHDAEISAWEDAGRAPSGSESSYQYGRRIEVNRSWTIYNVFTGIPAEIDGWTMVGLNRSHAKRALHILNTHNVRRALPHGTKGEEC